MFQKYLLEYIGIAWANKIQVNIYNATIKVWNAARENVALLQNLGHFFLVDLKYFQNIVMI